MFLNEGDNFFRDNMSKILRVVSEKVFNFLNKNRKENRKKIKQNYTKKLTSGRYIIRIDLHKLNFH